MYDREYGFYHGDAGGRARAASALRDNRGRFLCDYGFCEPAELDARLSGLDALLVDVPLPKDAGDLFDVRAEGV